MKFVELNEQEFAEFALQHELNNLWQTPNMANMREKRGFQSEYVGVEENGKLIAGTMLSSIPVFLGYRLYQLLRGPLIDFKDKTLYTFFHEQLLAYLSTRKCLYFHIDPYLPYIERDLDGNIVEGGFDNRDVVEMLCSLGYQHEGFTTGYDLSREPRWIYTIDLRNKTADDLLKQFERKTLRSVKKALKYKLRVSELDRDHLSIYHEIIENTRERRGFDGRDLSYYERLYDAFHDDGYLKILYVQLCVDDYKEDLLNDINDYEKECTAFISRLEKQESPKIRKKLELAQEQIQQLQEKVVEAENLKKVEGELVTLASGVFFTYGREVLCLMSGVYDKYMKFASPYAMHWEMLNYAIEHGMERYNLYGIDGLFNDSKETGVYLFKKGFNGEPLELIGDFDYIVNPAKYRMYRSLRNIKHKIKR